MCRVSSSRSTITIYDLYKHNTPKACCSPCRYTSEVGSHYTGGQILSVLHWLYSVSNSTTLLSGSFSSFIKIVTTHLTIE